MLLERLPLAAIHVVFAPLHSLCDVVRVVSAMEDLDIEGLVAVEGIGAACRRAAPLVQEACGLHTVHVGDVADVISRVVKALRLSSINSTTRSLQIVATPSTHCHCGAELGFILRMAVQARVQGLKCARTVLHVPKRCNNRSGRADSCGSYHWCNYQALEGRHYLRGDVSQAPIFFANARQAFDLDYLQMLRIRVCRLHTTFLGEADVLSLQSKMYGAAPPPCRMRRLLQQVYFFWNAARSAQEMFIHEFPSADPAEACLRFPFDLSANPEDQLALFWGAYNAHWHRRWCTDLAQHHRRHVRLEITDGLAAALRPHLESCAEEGRECFLQDTLDVLSGTPEHEEMCRLCDDNDVQRAKGVLQVVKRTSVDEDEQQAHPAYCLISMAAVEQNMFVMDGHMKCHRTRCGALRVAKLDCPGYGSDVYRGCLETPLVGALFCAAHYALQLETVRQFDQALVNQSDMPELARRLLKGKIARQVAKQAVAGHLSEGAAAADLRELAVECERCVKEDPAKCVGSTTGGVLTACTTSGYFCGWEEIHDTEALSQRYSFVARLFLLNVAFRIVAHDDACHMARLFASARRALVGPNEFFKRLLAIVWILDQWHAKNHVGAWCQANVSPALPFLAPFLRGHNTEVCESTNAWLAGFKHAVRHMHQYTFKFHLATNMDCHNEILRLGGGAHLLLGRVAGRGA